MSNHSALGGLRSLLLVWLLAASGCGSGLSWNRSASQEKPVLDQGQQVDVQLALGRTFEKQQQWNAARTVYTEILRRHPEHSVAAHRLAIVCDLRQDRESAAKWFEQALQHDPENADIFCDIAYSLYQQEDMTGAEANFRQALALEPHHRRAQNQLGLVLARTNRREEALAQFQKAGCTPSEAHSNLAFALGVHREPEQAAAEWEIASRSAPDLPEHRRRLDAVASLIARVAATEEAKTAPPTAELAARPADVADASLEGFRSASTKTTAADSATLR